MPTPGSSAASIAVQLEMPASVVIGLSAIATIRVSNRSDAPALVSARVNLMEGDLGVVIRGPDGATRTLKGWQADTALRRMTLSPGEELVSGLNLLATDSGPVFTDPGRYELYVEYMPAVREPAVRSNPVTVEARLPASESERARAVLLGDPAVREALLLGKADEAPAALADLAARFGTTLEGRVAHALVSGKADHESVADGGGSFHDRAEELAILFTTIHTPFSKRGAHAAGDLAAIIERAAASSDGAPAARLSGAARIARRLPVKRR